MADTYLERYLRGDCEQVWDDLIALGDHVREEPIYSDALAVARETMTRAKRNIEILYERLNTMSYLFAWPDQVIQPPDADVISQIDQLESLVGPLPLSLRAWYEIVGGVDFDGIHPLLAPPDMGLSPDLDASDPWIYSDPLVVNPLDRHLEEYEYRKFRLNLYDYDSMLPKSFPLDIAPNAIMKTGSEEGESYVIRVPDQSADALLEGEWHETTFVNFLRICFQWGGFPGFDLNGFAEIYRADAQQVGEVKVPPEIFARLTEGLLPI
jgi:hypothetical protein